MPGDLTPGPPRPAAMAGAPAIAAAVELKPGRYPDRTTQQLYRDAVAALLDVVPAARGRLDGLLTPPRDMGGPHPDTFYHEKLMEELGITPRLSVMLNAGGATYGYMIQYAALAISAGMAEAVLCVGAGRFEKMSPASAAQMIIQVERPLRMVAGRLGFSIERHLARMNSAAHGTSSAYMAATGSGAKPTVAMRFPARRSPQPKARAYSSLFFGGGLRPPRMIGSK